MFLSQEKKKSVLFLLVIIILTSACYYPALNGDFVSWDDDVHLTNNTFVRVLDAEHVKDIFTSKVNGIYIPLTVLSFSIEYAFFKYQPFIYHLNNLLLHLAVTLCLFVLSRKLGLTVFGAFISALVFGIHPIHVESVAWVTERKDVLSGFFYVAAILTYLKFLKGNYDNPVQGKKTGYGFLVITTILGVLSLLSKPMALSLPLILILIDWFKGRRIDRKSILEKIPLFIIIIGLTLITYVDHARVPGENPFNAVLIWAWTFTFYLRQFLFPIILLPIHRLSPNVSLANPEYVFAFMTLALVVFALVRLRKNRWFVFACLFYILSIFFLLRFDDALDLNVVANRFMYLPSIGFCLLFGKGIESIVEKAQKNKKPVVLMGIVLVILSIGTFYVGKSIQLSKVWSHSTTLWSHQLKYSPDEHFALINLAHYLAKTNEYRVAKNDFKEVLKYTQEGIKVSLSAEKKESMRKVHYLRALLSKALNIQEDEDAYYNLGKLYHDIGLSPQAAVVYSRALAIDPKYVLAHFELGNLYRDAGEVDNAIRSYMLALEAAPSDENEDYFIGVSLALKEARRKNPENQRYALLLKKALDEYEKFIFSSSKKATSFFNLGFLYMEMGEFDRAKSSYEMALDINPNHSKTLYNLGNLYKDFGKYNEAMEYYEKSVRVDTRNSDAYLNIGNLYSLKKEKEKAREYYKKAIKADGRNGKAYFNLAFTYEEEGKVQDAIKYYQKAIDSDSSNPESYYNLGNIYSDMKKIDEAIGLYEKTVEINQNHLNAWINLYAVHYNRQEFEKAAKYFEEAILLGYKAPEEIIQFFQEMKQQNQ